MGVEDFFCRTNRLSTELKSVFIQNGLKEITAERLEQLSAEMFLQNKETRQRWGVISFAPRNVSFLRSLDHWYGRASQRIIERNVELFV